MKTLKSNNLAREFAIQFVDDRYSETYPFTESEKSLIVQVMNYAADCFAKGESDKLCQQIIQYGMWSILNTKNANKYTEEVLECDKYDEKVDHLLSKLKHQLKKNGVVLEVV